LLADFQAQIVEESGNSTVVQVVATAKDSANLLEKLGKYGVRELVQSGAIAIELSEQTLAEQTALETGLASSETQSQLEDYQN